MPSSFVSDSTDETVTRASHRVRRKSCRGTDSWLRNHILTYTRTGRRSTCRNNRNYAASRPSFDNEWEERVTTKRKSTGRDTIARLTSRVSKTSIPRVLWRKYAVQFENLTDIAGTAALRSLTARFVDVPSRFADRDISRYFIFIDRPRNFRSLFSRSSSQIDWSGLIFMSRTVGLDRLRNIIRWRAFEIICSDLVGVDWLLQSLSSRGAGIEISCRPLSL